VPARVPLVVLVLSVFDGVCQDHEPQLRHDLLLSDRAPPGGPSWTV
jgi:hypothetical protein